MPALFETHPAFFMVDAAEMDRAWSDERAAVFPLITGKSGRKYKSRVSGVQTLWKKDVHKWLVFAEQRSDSMSERGTWVPEVAESLFSPETASSLPRFL